MFLISTLLGVSNFAASAQYEDNDRTLSSPFHQLPPEVSMQIFGYLKPRELSRVALVSRVWNDFSKDEGLWQSFLVQLGFKIPEKISSKALVITVLGLNTVNALISQLKEASMNEAFAALGYREARKRQTAGFKLGVFGYKMDKEAFKAWKNKKRTSPKIVKSKKLPFYKISTGEKVVQKSPRVEFLSQSYDNPTALKQAVILNEELIAKNDPSALFRKYLGHLLGEYGYEKDEKKALEVNEILVELGDTDGVQRKVFGLILGDHGYKASPDFFQNYCTLLGAEIDCSSMN